jgi:hypothetical protein
VRQKGTVAAHRGKRLPGHAPLRAFAPRREGGFRRRNPRRSWHRARTASDTAAASLAEGFEETLTVHRFGISDALRKTLVSTNPIESLFSQVANRCGRVKRWRTPAMVLRWCGTVSLAHEGRMHRVVGHASIPVLLQALQGASNVITNTD